MTELRIDHVAADLAAQADDAVLDHRPVADHAAVGDQAARIVAPSSRVGGRKRARV